MVPETTVNENDAFEPWKDNIWFAGEVFAVKPKAETR